MSHNLIERNWHALGGIEKWNAPKQNVCALPRNQAWHPNVIPANNGTYRVALSPQLRKATLTSGHTEHSPVLLPLLLLRYNALARSLTRAAKANQMRRSWKLHRLSLSLAPSLELSLLAIAFNSQIWLIINWGRAACQKENHSSLLFSIYFSIPLVSWSLFRLTLGRELGYTLD